MLGHLLKFSVGAKPAAETLDVYRSLGFQSLEVSDIPGAPYAALWDGTITLGLLDAEFDMPVPTFVRPDLKTHLRTLRRLGVDFTFTRLADDEFNQAGFLDPNGQRVVLVEARTFSPAPREPTSVPACGEFLEWSVATHSLQESEAFWAALGFGRVAAGDNPYPWLRLAGHGLVVGFHETPRLGAGLTFRSIDLEARLEYLEVKGIRVRRGAPLASAGENSATLLLPDKMPVYLLETQR
jgi:catechol 2,3-dioxygenase-like lactoylglutathione lyase family enzyme